MSDPTQYDDRRRMRLSREVRIGELVATLVAISTIATGYIELRLRPVEQQIAALEKASTDFKTEIRQDLRELNQKLDRLIDSLAQRPAR